MVGRVPLEKGKTGKNESRERGKKRKKKPEHAGAKRIKKSGRVWLVWQLCCPCLAREERLTGRCCLEYIPSRPAVLAAHQLALCERSNAESRVLRVRKMKLRRSQVPFTPRWRRSMTKAPELSNMWGCGKQGGPVSRGNEVSLPEVWTSGLFNLVYAERRVVLSALYAASARPTGWDSWLIAFLRRGGHRRR